MFADPETKKVTEKDAVSALLLSLGVDLEQTLETLTLADLHEILRVQVEEADPLDGICTELADMFDHEYTGECTYAQLEKFLDEQCWLGGNEVELRKSLEDQMGTLSEKDKVIDYRGVLLRLIS